MRIQFVVMAIVLLSTSHLKAQEQKATTEFYKCSFGAEFQAYPAGQMYGLRGEYYFSPKAEVNLRVGYNRAFRYDFSGLNDNEQGGGWGVTPGFRYHFFRKKNSSFFAGIRCDIWQLSIDWIDENNVPREGNTKITVVQPTFDFGYSIALSARWKATAALAFGQEINIVTRGDEVGQGGISLIGITFARSFLN